jgi:outer membrane receptor protein involved in Fe transport
MYLFRICALLCTITLSTYNTYGQGKTTIQGIVVDSSKEKIDGATIKLNQTITHSDSKGNFKINVADDVTTALLEVSAVGKQTLKQTLNIAQARAKTLYLVLEDDPTQLATVDVLGLTKTQEVNKQAYNVTAIDAKKLHNTTLDISHTLDRVSGVRVRESGGVGSNINFSLNGFSGNQVKFFIDGIPLENFGTSFQINNIPINAAERIEVYKGVVPVWLGSDALGGAVNIVSNNSLKNYLDISYSGGSFNTHRSAINAAITSKKGFTVQLNAFQNYSDNNYKVTLDVSDINTGALTANQTVERFHDKYRNETVILNMGVVDKPWADKLLVGITLGENYNEVQTGARMISVFGSWHRRGNTLMPTLKYQKQDFIAQGLDFNLTANYNFGKEHNIDTLFRRYDWYGNFKNVPGVGGERSRSFYRYGDNVGVVTSTLSYRINERHSIAINNVLSAFNRQGFDELSPDSKVNFIPQKNLKNILGFGYKYDITDRWSSSLFAKSLYQRSQTALASASSSWNNDELEDISNKVNHHGYGIATSYYILPDLQAKASYEKSNRLPVNHEMFGDNINQDSNFDLRPEISNNVNIGANYQFGLGKDHRFMTGLTGIYRRAKDFIYFRLNNNSAKTVADNLEGVSTKGAELELKYAYKNFLALDVNYTYQDIRNMVKYTSNSTSVSAIYKDRIPNIPYSFGNTALSFFFNKIFYAHDNLSVTHNLLYVEHFYLNWPSRGTKDQKHVIPSQLSHDINLVYSLWNGKYNIALESKNLTNAKLYDNFSLQKPGRAFYLKLRYFISK